MLAENLDILIKMFINYTDLIYKMVDRVSRGMQQKDREQLAAVLNDLENRANAREIQIEERCISILAKFEPKARDLRTVLMIFKINNDLERMGDHAVNIAESGMYLIDKKFTDYPAKFAVLLDDVLKMYRDSIDSFIESDSALAQDVLNRDDTVDDLEDRILAEIIKKLRSGEGKVKEYINLERVIRNYERIADLSTNICEDVIYIDKAKVIKHHLEEE